MPRSPRDRRREERIIRRDQLALLSRMMMEPIGRDYFYSLLASLHVYSTSFATDPHVMAFSEGERNVGLAIQLDLMEANPDAFLLMLKEHVNVRPEDTGADSDAGDDTGDDYSDA